jgi:hypothetical protein
MKTASTRFTSAKKGKLEALLKNIEAGFVPKEFVISANVRTRDGESFVLTPDEYEDMILKEAEHTEYASFNETNILEMRMLLDLEKINKVLEICSKEVLLDFSN